MKGVPYALAFAVVAMLAASCLVFAAPAVQADSAVECSTVEVVEEPPSGEPPEEVIAMADEPLSADEPITDDDIAAFGEPVCAEEEEPAREHRPPMDGPRRDDRGPGMHRGAPIDMAPPPGSDTEDGTVAFGSEVGSPGDAPDKVFGMPMDPYREYGPRTVTVIDEELWQRLLYDMLLSPLNLTSEIGQTELPEDDDADGVDFLVTEEEDSEDMPEADVPVTSVTVPPEHPAPNVIIDTLRASQVVADLS